MEHNILDELLNKIKDLENENHTLKEKLINIDQEDTNNEAEDDEEASDEKMLIDNESKGTLDRKNILNNVKEVCITHIPIEHHSKMYILGDFTAWEPILMDKHRDVFSYKTILIKGFKYYYSFQVHGNITVDTNAPYENNARTGQVNNYLIVNKEGSNEELKDFDFKQHGII